MTYFIGIVKTNSSRTDGKPPGFFMKAGLGMTAGMAGAFVGTPAEVALIRMTADGRLPLAERRNYKSVFDALFRITKEEGLLTLWRGAIPTMGRAMVVNAAQLASYSQAKQLLMDTGAFYLALDIYIIFKSMRCSCNN
jgi:solute carrier family 25 (mitochondrial oxoglutarate transporter), member 11